MEGRIASCLVLPLSIVSRWGHSPLRRSDRSPKVKILGQRTSVVKLPTMPSDLTALHIIWGCIKVRPVCRLR